MKKFTEEQKEAIYTVDKNLVVSAGAGSGKTTVLSARYEYLIDSGLAGVDEILTLTFTEKAASEMKSRIRQDLAKSSNPKVAKELLNFRNAEISTIDSFCRRVVINANQDLGLPDTFSSDLKKLDEIIRDEVFDFANKSRIKLVEEAISGFGFEVFWNDVSRIASQKMLIADGADFVEDFHKAMDFLRESIEEILLDLSFFAKSLLFDGLVLDEVDFILAKKMREKFEAGFLPIKEYLIESGLTDYEGLKKLNREQGLLPIVEKIRGLTAIKFDQRPKDETMKAYVGLKKAILKNFKVYAGLSSRSNFTSLEQLFEQILEFPSFSQEVEAYLELKKRKRTDCLDLNSALFYFSKSPEIEEFCSALNKLSKRIVDIKKASGLTSFDDISSAAIYLLKVNRELRDYYKKKFKFIMIDEFQDNNKLQKELLYLLAERPEIHSEGVPSVAEICSNKLFFVGDQKQSIYRFRGADVRVFKSLSEELACSGGKEINLSNNFRSEPELIDFFNFLFLKVMAEKGSTPLAQKIFDLLKGKKESVAKVDYEAVFSEMKSRSAKVSPKFKKVMLAIKPQAKREESEEDEESVFDEGYCEALYIARKIKQIVDGSDYILPGDNGSTRKACYSDVAVLMRTLSEQYKLEKVFDLAGIPYVTDTTTSLFFSDMTADFLAVIESVLYYNSKKAFYSVIRSAFLEIDDGKFYPFIKKYGNLKEFLLNMLSNNEFSREDFAECQILAYLSLDYEGFLEYKKENQLKDVDDFDCRVYSFYSGVIGQILKGSIASFFDYLWMEKGYRFLYLSGQTDPSYRQIFDVLFRMAQKFDAESKGFDEFLSYGLERLNNYEKVSDLNLPNFDSNAVRFMTIHKSKGLEFPICFVAFSGKSARVPSTSFLSYLGDNLAIKVKDDDGVNPVSRLYWDEEQAMDSAELKRLLYVALTRAETYLFISGCYGNSKNPNSGTLLRFFYDEKSESDSQESLELYEGLSDFVELESIEDLSIDKVIIDARLLSSSPLRNGDFSFYSPENCVKEIFPKRRYPVVELNELFYKKNRPKYCASVDEFETKNIIPAWFDELLYSNGLNSVFGTIVHGTIENFIKNKELSVPRQLSQLVPPEFLDDINEMAKKSAKMFLSSDIYREVESSASRIQSEFPFLFKLNLSKICLLINGNIDLYCEINGEIRVIDFKTDAKPLNQYSLQLNIYRRALEALTGLPVRTFLFFLRTGKNVEIKEDIPLEEIEDLI
ncbi:MAG: UvrD-helicase domain-containing protein [Spirochaetales bacterium]|nr:UvrD-helicase domain-containing protein [Spirochaetales bacterium]